MAVPDVGAIVRAIVDQMIVALRTAHTQVQLTLSDVIQALNYKSDIGHTHTMSDITNLQEIQRLVAETFVNTDQISITLPWPITAPNACSIFVQKLYESPSSFTLSADGMTITSTESNWDPGTTAVIEYFATVLASNDVMINPNATTVDDGSGSGGSGSSTSGGSTSGSGTSGSGTSGSGTSGSGTSSGSSSTVSADTVRTYQGPQKTVLLTASAFGPGGTGIPPNAQSFSGLPATAFMEGGPGIGPNDVIYTASGPSAWGATASEYNIMPSATSINAGGSVTFNISTNNVSAGTQMNYTLSGNNILASTVGGSLAGSFTIDQTGSAEVTVSVAADYTASPTRQLIITLSNGAAASVTVVSTT